MHTNECEAPDACMAFRGASPGRARRRRRMVLAWGGGCAAAWDGGVKEPVRRYAYCCSVCVSWGVGGLLCVGWLACALGVAGRCLAPRHAMLLGRFSGAFGSLLGFACVRARRLRHVLLREGVDGVYRCATPSMRRMGADSCHVAFVPYAHTHTHTHTHMRARTHTHTQTSATCLMLSSLSQGHRRAVRAAEDGACVRGGPGIEGSRSDKVCLLLYVLELGRLGLFCMRQLACSLGVPGRCLAPRMLCCSLL